MKKVILKKTEMIGEKNSFEAYVDDVFIGGVYKLQVPETRTNKSGGVRVVDVNQKGWTAHPVGHHQFARGRKSFPTKTEAAKWLLKVFHEKVKCDYCDAKLKRSDDEGNHAHMLAHQAEGKLDINWIRPHQLMEPRPVYSDRRPRK